MSSDKNIKEKLEKLRKKRMRAFFRNTILISLFATIAAVGFTWLEMRNIFIFLFIAFLPSLASILWDKKPGRFGSKTVSAFNITGMFPYILAAYNSGSPDVVARDAMIDPKAWLLIYGFAVLGWGVVFLVPRITLVVLELRSRFMISKMQKFQDSLSEEWGEEVKK